jgi:hypothetical protein
MASGNSLPQLSWAVLGGHLDLVDDGVSVVGDPTTASPTDLPVSVEPSARLAEVSEYPLDFLVGSLRPSRRRPLDHRLCIRERSAH